MSERQPYVVVRLPLRFVVSCHSPYADPTSECRGVVIGRSSLSVNDGASAAAGVLLMTGGLCLQGPADQRIGYESVPTPAPLQRVQAPNGDDLAATVAPAPRVQKLRVLVTATNGVKQARINEIRVYDSDGLAPFPEQPK